MTGDPTESSKRNDNIFIHRIWTRQRWKLRSSSSSWPIRAAASTVWSPSTLQQVWVWNFLQSWSLQVLYCCSLVCIFVHVCIDGVCVWWPNVMNVLMVCCSHTWCICSLCGQWDFSVQSSVALWENDRVCPARHQRFALQWVRLLVRVRGFGDSRRWRGQVRPCLRVLLRVFKKKAFSGVSSCRCCKVHDKCYEESRTLPGCTAVGDLPYIIDYEFTCSNEQVTCSGEAVLCSVCV